MGQQDPLVAWQQEGYSMFGQLIDAIDDDYVKYVMHVQVIEEAPDQPDLSGASYEAADDPVQGPGAMPHGGPLHTSAEHAGGEPGGAPMDDLPTQEPVHRSEHEKLGRNEPCWCGSGKKFKHCHGR